MGKSFLLLQFTDLAGVFRSTTIKWDGRGLDDVLALFDGSSVIGFTGIEYSDLVLRPIKETVKEIPWYNGVYRAISKVYLPSGIRLIYDPRFIAEKTLGYIKSLGYEPKMGVELEFFIFDNIEVLVRDNEQHLYISSIESPWERGYGIKTKAAYHVQEPLDTVAEIRREVVKTIEEFGYDCVKNHHEVATAGQVEVSSNTYDPVKLGDYIQTFKMIARKISRDYGMEAVFLPKPIPRDNGNGMHIHSSLWRDGKNLFHDENDEYGLSQLARYFIGGLIEHGRSLSAIVSPTVNSYRRLVPGYEAPVYLLWGIANRSTAIRIPAIKFKPNSMRIEYRPPDSLANPYLASSAILLAGIDGIKKNIDPGDPYQGNVYEIPLKKIPKEKRLPRNLSEALDELESDHEYLKPVFSKEVLERYIEIKRKEVKELAPNPAPIEYIYYSIY